jgi:hypothetical protein
MMTAPKHRPLLETLPRLRGRVRADAPSVVPRSCWCGRRMTRIW